MPTRDEVLEEIAEFIGRFDFMEVRGVLAKRKRAREDAELRGNVIRETRARMAEEVRRMKGSRRDDPVAVLRRIEASTDKRTEYLLREAWPLMWSRLVTIEAHVDVGGPGVVPATRWTVAITDKGRRLLDRENAAA